MNALRTLSMRLRGTKAETLQELGEDTDGLIEVTAKLRETILSLAHVDITDVNGNLRSTYDVMRDIAGVWDTLSTNTQANLLETIAGKNRASDVAALMRNWEQVEKAMQAATEASGTAQAEQEKYLNSLQGHLNQFTAAWQVLSTSLLNSDALKVFVDIGTAIIGGITAVGDFVDSIGGLITIISALAATFMIFNGEFIAFTIQYYAFTASEVIKTVWTTIGNGLKNVITNIQAAIIAWQSYANGVTSASVAMNASVPIIGLALAAITAITACVSAYNNAQKEVQNKAIEAGEAQQKQTESFQSSYITIQKYLGQTKLTTEQENAFNSAVENVARSLGGKKIALGNTKDAQAEYRKELEETAKAEMETYLTQAKIARNAAKNKVISSSKTTTTDTWQGVSTTSREFELMKSIMGDMYNRRDANWIAYFDLKPTDSKNADSIIEYYYKLIELRNKLADENLMDNAIFKNVEASINGMTEAVEEYISAQTEQLQLEYQIANGIPKTIDEYVTMRNAILQTIDGSDAYKKVVQSILDSEFESFFNVSYHDVIVSKVDEIKNAFREAISSDSSKSSDDIDREMDEFNSWIEGLTDDELDAVYNISISPELDTSSFSLDDWKNAVDNFLNDDLFLAGFNHESVSGFAAVSKNLTEAYKAMSQAEKEMNDGMSLSQETISSLSSFLEKDERIEDYIYLDKETGTLKLDIELWRQRADAMFNSDVSSLSRATEEFIRENEILAKTRDELVRQMQEQEYHGNVDLFNRKIVMPQVMRNAGWTDFDGEYATLFGSTITSTSEEGIEWAVNLTPILPDGSVLSPDALYQYVDEIVASGLDVFEADKVENGGLGLVLEAKIIPDENSRDEIIEDVASWGEGLLHGLHTDYSKYDYNNAMIDYINGILDMYDDLYASITNDKLDLSGMFGDVGSLKSEAKELVTAIQTVESGTALTMQELYALAETYPTLFESVNLDELDGDVEKQQAALSGQMDNYELAFEDIIDVQLAILDAAKAEAEAVGESTEEIDNLINKLVSYKDNGFAGLFAPSKGNTESDFDKIDKVISSVSKAQKLIKEINSDSPDILTIISGISEIAESEGKSIADYFQIVEGEFVFSRIAIEDWATEYVNSLAGIDGVTQEFIDALIEQITATEEAANAYDEMSDAISNAQKATQLLADIQSGDGNMLDMFQSIVSMAKESGDSISDFFYFDGENLIFNQDKIKDWRDSWIDGLGIEDETLVNWLKNQSQAVEDTIEPYENLSNAISKVSKASSYLTKVNSGEASFIDMLSDITALMQEIDGSTIGDFITFDANNNPVYQTTKVTEWINSYIDAMVTAGDITETVGQQFKNAAQAELEQQSAFEQLTSTMEKAQKVASLLSDVQKELADDGKVSINTLSSLMDVYGDKWADYVNFFDNGSFTINTAKMKEDMLSAIDEAEKIAPEYKQTIKDILEVEIEESNFHEAVDSYVKDIKTLQEAADKISSGELTSNDIFSLIREFPELASQTDNLGEAIASLMASMDTDIMAVFEQQLASADTEEARAEILGLMKTIEMLRAELGQNETLGFDFDFEEKSFSNVINAIKESVSATGLSIESLNNLKNRYQNLDSYNPSALFEKTANGIHLNTKALRELEAAYEKQEKMKLDTKLNDLVKQYNELTKQINNADNAAGSSDLYAKRADILLQIEETAELAAQYEGLTSAFYKWQLAQSSGEEGDMYDSLAGGLKNIKELYDEGLIGTNKFRTAVQLMTNEDLTNATSAELLAAYEKGYPKMERYFQDSSDGVLNFLHDVENLNSEWVHMNEDGSWDIDFGVGNDKAIADALGINVEAVQSILRKLSDYGFDINLDSMYTDLGTIKTKAEEAADALRKMGATDYKFDFGVTNVERLNEEIEAAKDMIKSLYNEDGTLKVGVDEDTLQQAQYVLATLLMQKQEIDKPIIMQIDASNVAGNSGAIIRQIQEIQKAAQTVSLKASVGADTTQAQTSLNTAMAGLAPEIKAKIGITDDMTAEEIQAQIAKIGTIDLPISSIDISEEALTQAVADAELEGKIVYSVDDTSIVAFEGTERTVKGKAVFEADMSKANGVAPKTKYGTAYYTAKLNDWTPPTKYGTVIYTPKMGAQANGSTGGGTISSGGSGLGSNLNMARAIGTAHVRGTAFARGDWGIRGNGFALGGELGRELVVRDGKYFTIGDTGAEFFKYQDGDIVFNASQTEMLLGRGSITHGDRRGKVFASGSAFSSGTGVITGGGQIITTPGKPGSGDGGGDSSGSDDKEPQIVDWIEVAIKRIERLISNASRVAESTFKTLKQRLAANSDEMVKIQREITIQQQGTARYMQQADSVGLSGDLKALVQSGAIDIKQYDEDTQKLIEDYQKWYEKALACSDAVDELRENLSELYSSRFDAIATDFENQLSSLEHRTNMLNGQLSMIEAKGYLGGTNIYQSLIANESAKISKLTSERSTLQSELNAALSSGAIQYGSEAYYEMQQKIDAVTESIQESQVAVEEYNNAIRQIEWSQFDFALDRMKSLNTETQFLIDLLGSSDMFDENGKITSEGMATQALHASNYDIYMGQSKKYGEEIQKLNRQIANDPYDTALIERREQLLQLQQQSILSAQKEKQAMVDLVKEGIEAELSSLKKLIDAYKDSLDSAKDLYDYQNKVSKQSKNIADIQKQIAAYEKDSSEENKARLQKLRSQLVDAQENLQDTQYSQYIKDQKKMLDDLYESYEEILNSRLDNIDALISDIRADANLNATAIASTIQSEASSVGYTMSDGLKSIWSSGGSAVNVVSMYSGQITTITNTLGAIHTYVQRIANAGDSVSVGGNIGGFSSGGIVSSMRRVTLKNGDDAITVNTLSVGESVFTADETEQIKALVDAIPVITKMMDMTAGLNAIRGAVGGTGDSNVTYEVNIPIEHVSDYNDFISQMQKDGKFEKFIQSMTVDRIAGGSRFAKYRQQW